MLDILIFPKQGELFYTTFPHQPSLCQEHFLSLPCKHQLIFQDPPHPSSLLGNFSANCQVKLIIPTLGFHNCLFSQLNSQPHYAPFSLEKRR